MERTLTIAVLADIHGNDRALEAVSEHVDRWSPDRVVVVGGGSANGLLNRLVADCTGLPVVTGSTESTALGNAAVQVATLRGLGDRRALGGLLPGADPVAEPRDAPGHRHRMEGARDRLRQHGGGMS